MTEKPPEGAAQRGDCLVKGPCGTALAEATTPEPPGMTRTGPPVTAVTSDGAAGP